MKLFYHLELFYEALSSLPVSQKLLLVVFAIAITLAIKYDGWMYKKEKA